MHTLPQITQTNQQKEWITWHSKTSHLYLACARFRWMSVWCHRSWYGSPCCVPTLGSGPSSWCPAGAPSKRKREDSDDSVGIHKGHCAIDCDLRGARFETYLCQALLPFDLMLKKTAFIRMTLTDLPYNLFNSCRCSCKEKPTRQLELLGVYKKPYAVDWTDIYGARFETQYCQNCLPYQPHARGEWILIYRQKSVMIEKERDWEQLRNTLTCAILRLSTNLDQSFSFPLTQGTKLLQVHVNPSWYIVF